MATSGITEYSITRDDIIKAALRKLSVLAKGQTPDTEDYTNASLALNALVAEYRTKGMQLWARKEYTFTPTVSTASYNIGTGQTLNTPYPIKMLQAYRMDSGATIRIPMEIVANYNYNMFPATSSGLPIQLTYQPKVQMGVIQVWPTPDSSATTSTITLVYQRPFEFFNASTDNPDFPEEWYNALIYGLARDLAPEWGIPLMDRQVLAKEAKDHVETAMDNGGEDSSLFWQVHRVE